MITPLQAKRIFAAFLETEATFPHGMVLDPAPWHAGLALLLLFTSIRNPRFCFLFFNLYMRCRRSSLAFEFRINGSASLGNCGISIQH